MSYRVFYAPSFSDDIERHIDYLIEQHVSIDRIDRWYGKLFKLVDSLSESPRRFAVDDIQTKVTGLETRKANVGDYLVFYDIDEEHKRVNVFAFIHGARRRESDSPPSDRG